MREIVLASNNEHKIEEFRAFLSGLDISILSMKEIGFCDEIIEDGDSFYTNAFIKAKAVHDFSQKMVISDDSGLEVDALNGSPGVLSARFAGLGSKDSENTQKLLKDLEGIENRKAHFTAVLCLIDGHSPISYFEGRCFGNITTSVKGSTGFGYDPVFIPQGYNLTFAELGQQVKNELSHRGKAINLLTEHLKDRLNEN